jgi:hypothetical protein
MLQTVQIVKTGGLRVGDTVEFFPTHCRMPATSATDNANFAAKELIAAIQNPTPATPFAQLGTERLAALKQLAEIFNADKIDKSAPSPRVAKPTIEKVVPAPSPRVAKPTSDKNGPASPPRVEPAHRYLTRSTQANHIMAGTITSEPAPTKLLANQTILQQTTGSKEWQPIIANHVIHPTTGKIREYRDLTKDHETKTTWTRSFASELGRLAQGVRGRYEGTDTIHFIPVHKMPAGRLATYGRIVVDLQPQKQEVERTRLTVGGNLIDYPGNVSAKIADMTTAKLLFNSVISTPDAKFMGLDISNYYLGTPLDRYEYMRLPINLIPDEIIQEYDLLPLVHNNYVYIEIRKDMYGLPQAGILAQNLLKKRLTKHGYRLTRHTHGLWKHDTKPVMFCLVVDDFDVKYVGKHNAQHLVDAINDDYKTTVNWDGTLYCDVTIKWDYIQRTCDISIPNYV